MKKLTSAEEQIMQILWELKEGFVKDLIEKMPEPKPAYNTVSTITRILEKKEFVSHKSYGKSHQYYPLISKEEYTQSYYKSFMKDYFGNSFQRMVSFFAKQENLSISEIDQLMKLVKEDIESKEE